MTSLDEAWGPVRRRPEQRPAVPPTPPPPAPHAPSHAPTQSEKDAKTAAERVPDAAAAAAAANVGALKQLHQALMELRRELDERDRKPIEAAGAAAAYEHRRTLHSTIDALTITIGIGFLLLIICIALTGTAICRAPSSSS
jgi:hypothetical protein